ncbi:cytochrome-c oxidase, cbb3-type subunit III, partial [Salmonella enterica subsp. enterica serovar Virchow]|nr:cytochrome-c oxidase, cbb3-type subunit III [Salmonella enterica subsp. enterica serovar Virchow]
MEVGERDPITGRTTTGHEWNGIKELTTPVPRVVMVFLLLGTAFSIVYWLLMPAWPLWTSYTKGLLGNDQRAIVANQVETARVERAAWLDKVQSMDFDAIKADPVLMERVKEFGHVLFTDNCAACHGMQGTGGP